MDSMSSIERTLLSKWSTKDVNEVYVQEAVVGVGTYGVVFKAHSIEDKTKIVALKKLNVSKETEGVEIKSNEQNKRGSTFLVFDFIEHDFMGLMQRKISFSLPQIKCLMKQLLEGLEYVHMKNIIHRDIKSANLLLSKKGELKIADFGLARFQTKGNMTNRVVTLWYRAPEILLGSKKYTSQIDMWSAGCFFADLLIGRVLFPGDKEPRQIELIYEKCGSPDEEIWPGVRSLPLFTELGPKKIYSRNLLSFMRSQKQNIDEQALNLLDNLLAMNPEKRFSAKEALSHSFFTCEPLPCDSSCLPKIESECHCFIPPDNQTAQFQHNNINQNYQLHPYRGFFMRNDNFHNNNSRNRNNGMNYSNNTNNNNYRVPMFGNINNANMRNNGFGHFQNQFGVRNQQNVPNVNVNMINNSNINIKINVSNDLNMSNFNNHNDNRIFNKVNMDRNNNLYPNFMNSNNGNNVNNLNNNNNNGNPLKRKNSNHFNDFEDSDKKIKKIKENEKDLNRYKNPNVNNKKNFETEESTNKLNQINEIPDLVDINKKNN